MNRRMSCVLYFKRKFLKFLYQFLLLGSLALFVCEFAIYPLIISQCAWPNKMQNDENEVRAMFVADTHLLGPFRGHWFDKLRREWQMYRAFQTAVGFFNPEVIFFLGDLFDEGEWVSKDGFQNYVTRFQSMFAVPSHIDIYVVAGNHDIGFHYAITPKKTLRFETAFKSSAVQLLRLKATNFLLINSMAMEMDGCFLCKMAIQELGVIRDTLECQKNATGCKIFNKIENPLSLEEYSRPIILQHFPLYRKSDAACTGKDASASLEPFMETVDCLSEKSSSLLLKDFSPQLIISGHTHSYCKNYHNMGEVKVPEYSVPSFSWRNRNNPSFFLAKFSKSKYQLSNCLLPVESTVLLIYGISGIILLLLQFSPVIKTSLKYIFSKFMGQS